MRSLIVESFYVIDAPLFHDQYFEGSSPSVPSFEAHDSSLLVLCVVHPDSVNRALQRHDTAGGDEHANCLAMNMSDLQNVSGSVSAREHHLYL